MARELWHSDDPGNLLPQGSKLSSPKLLKEGLEIHLVPSIQYLVSLDDEERRPVQYPTLAGGGKTEVIAEMSHSDLPWKNATRSPSATMSSIST